MLKNKEREVTFSKKMQSPQGFTFLKKMQSRRVSGGFTFLKKVQSRRVSGGFTFLKKMQSPQGFTLIELLIVIAIIAILMALIFVSFTQVQRSSRDAQRKSDLQTVAGVLQRFYSDNSVYPTSNSGVIRINTSDCDNVSSGLSDVAWGTGVFTCNSINYQKQLPRDPIGTTQYCYEVVAANQNYNLYAHLEGAGNITPSVTCGGNPGYNYRVTPND